jgi:uncharacterized membrane protein YidH (DUF202 family)
VNARRSDAPGLPEERTALAWHRSALAVATIGAFLVKAAAETDETVLVVVSAVVLGGLALVVWAFGSRAYAERRTATWDLARQRRALRLMTGVVLISAALAAAIAVWASA